MGISAYVKSPASAMVPVLHTYFTDYISCYWHINECGHYTANICNNVLILQGNLDATLSHVPKHNQLQDLLHVIVIYVPVINMG